MKQFLFEVKKLHRQKVYLLVVIVALAMSWWTIQTIEYPHFFNPLLEMDFSASESLYEEFAMPLFEEQTYRELTAKENELITEYYEVEETSEGYREIRRNFNNELATSESFLKEKLIYLDNVDNFINKHQISLKETTVEGMEWERFETKYLLDNNLPYEEGGLTEITSSLIFRYGLDTLFGMGAMIMFALIVSRSLPQEISSGTINNRYLQPKAKTGIIFSKLFAFMTLALLYVLMALLLIVLYSVLYKGGVGNLMFPLRIYGSSSAYLNVWQFLLISIALFLVLVSFVSSLSLFIGSMTRKPVISTLLTLFILVVGVSVTSTNADFQTWLNPFHLTNYRELIVGSSTIHPSGQITGVGSVITHSSGLKIFIVPVILAIFFLIGTVFFLTKERNEKETRIFKFANWDWISNEAFRFEVKKISSAVSLPFSILTISIIVLIFFIQTISDDTWRINYFMGNNGTYELLETQVVESQVTIDELQLILDSETIGEEEYREVSSKLSYEMNSLKYYKDELNILNSLRNAYYNKDSTAYYRRMPTKINDSFAFGVQIENAPETGIFPQYVRGEISRYAYSATRNFNSQLQQREIEPIVGTTKLPTVYDELISVSAANEEAKYNTPAVMTGLNSWYRFIEAYSLDTILLGLVVIFFASGYSLEKEEGNHLGFILTQPQSRLKLILNKMLASVLVGGIFISVIVIVLFVFGTFRGGLGHLDYPILRQLHLLSNPWDKSYNFIGDYEFMNLSIYWLKSLVMLAFGLVFVVSFSTFLSLFIKNRISHSITTILLLGIGIVLTEFNLLGGFIAYIPTTYLRIGSTIDGSLMAITNSANVNFTIAILVLSLWTLIFSALTIELNEKIELM